MADCADTIGAWLANATNFLNEVSDSARIDAESLLAFVLEKERSFFYTWPEYSLSETQKQAADKLLKRRREGEPVAYIIGEREFWSLPLFTSPATLIPRADTETLVVAALDLSLPENARVLDLGTGTGAIAIAIAHERPTFQIEATDISIEACMLAERNRDRHHCNNLKIYPSRWFDQVVGQFDVIVSNPPYIAEDDPHLQQGDLRFEPRRALTSRQDGFKDICSIIASAPKYLHKGAPLLLEHGWQQGEAVRELMRKAGAENVRSLSDFQGHERVTIGTWI